jgi:hypothetical protein
MCSIHVKALSVRNGPRIKMGSDLNKYIAVLPNYDKLSPTGKDLVSKYFNKEVFHSTGFGYGKVAGFEIAERPPDNVEKSNILTGNFNAFILVKFKVERGKKKFSLEKADKFLKITGEKKYQEPN